jgi:hypothetical protein
MRSLSHSYYSNKSRKMHDRLKARLSRLDDEGFVRLVWAVDGLQSGREAAVARVFPYPSLLAVTDLSDPSFIPKYLLETLVNELLFHPKTALQDGSEASGNPGDFGCLDEAYSELRKLEDAEFMLQEGGLHEKLARIGNRQFYWQRLRFWPDLIRSLVLCDGPHTKSYFHEQAGITIQQFVLAGWGIYTLLKSEQFLAPKCELQALGLSQADFDRALQRIALPIEAARAKATQIRDPLALTAHRRSVLREKPCIIFGGGQRIRAPLPELIMSRCTEGLYFDVVSAGGQVTQEIGERFQKYCLDLLRSQLGEAEWRGSQRYGTKNNTKETPDIRMFGDGRCQLVFECKAKRKSFAAQFGSSGQVELTPGLDELAYGIFQIWRYFSHARLRLIEDEIDGNVFGLILTLDPWLLMSRHYLPTLLERANRFAEENGGITQEDRRPVGFLSVADLEAVLSSASVQSFLDAGRLAADPERVGWHFPSLHREVANAAGVRRDYPFKGRVADFLPWWNLITDP